MPERLEPGQSDRRDQEDDGGASGLTADDADHAYDASFVAAMQAALEAARRDLAEVDEASASARAPVELDQTRVGRLSRMDALQGQAMAQEQQRRRQTQFARISAALARIEAGDYGWCLGCGDAIARRRLESDPAAPQCVNCAGAKSL